MAINAIDIQKLYVAYFGRPADPGGLAFWTDALASDVVTLADISHTFADSAEYRDNFSHMDSRTIVGKIYGNLFEREAETGGLDFWTGLIDQGVISIDDVVRDISMAAVGTDAIAFNGKVAAAAVFTLRLDMPNEIVAYNGSAALELAMEFLATVKDRDSAANAADPVVVDAWIARIVAADGTGIDDVSLVGVAPLA